MPPGNKLLAIVIVDSLSCLHPETVTKDDSSLASFPVKRQSTLTPGMLLVTGFRDMTFLVPFSIVNTMEVSVSQVTIIEHSEQERI